MTFELPRGQPTRRRLLLGVAVIAALLVAQALVEDWCDRRSDSGTRALVRNAMKSVQQLAQIVHEVDRQRLALGAYVVGDDDDVSGVSLAEAMSALDADLAETVRTYAPLTAFPGEAERWAELSSALARYRQQTRHIVALARAGRSDEARRAMAELLPVYAELDRKLVRLHELNREGGARALERLSALQVSTRRLEWTVRVVVFLTLVLLGLWGARHITRYEDALAARSRDLDQRNRDLDAFAGRVAHDLKNALGPIVISPEMLRLYADQPKRIGDLADRTERCARKATAIIDALLAFSRAAQSAAPDETGALVPTVRNVLDEVAPLVTAVGATIEVGVIPDVQVRCSPGLLHVVLANVCGNAVKFLQGEPVRHVHISARVERTSCRIDVQDSGPGIPEELRTKIFAPFFRTGRADVPGTGIGLATVQRILDARGGRIEVSATDDRGARFTMWIPLA